MVRFLKCPILPIVCCLILLATACLGQDTASQVERRLAGDRAHDWVYKTVVMFMGPGDRCQQGEKYRFKADHTVVISQCVNSKMNAHDRFTYLRFYRSWFHTRFHRRDVCRSFGSQRIILL